MRSHSRSPAAAGGRSGASADPEPCGARPGRAGSGTSRRPTAPAAPDAAPGPGGPRRGATARRPARGAARRRPQRFRRRRPVDPNAGRIDNPVGGFSYVLPAGWVESDATHLDYGSALLSKDVRCRRRPGQPPPVANDTRVVLGKLDQKLYASAEPDNTKAATRLASDMGEFFMPYPGTRVNQETVAARTPTAWPAARRTTK